MLRKPSSPVHVLLDLLLMSLKQILSFLALLSVIRPKSFKGSLEDESVDGGYPCLI